MRINVKALALALALVWGILAMFLVGLLNLAWPDYGRPFLEMMASVYPGYHAAGGLLDLIVGTLYGALDGAIAGVVFGWLYNRFAVA